MKSNLLIPPSPIGETDTTMVSIVGATDQIIEESVEAIHGRVDIVNGNIIRSLPDCDTKSAVAACFIGEYYRWGKENQIYFVSASTGVRYVNGNFLTANVAARKRSERPLDRVSRGHYHLYHAYNTAPNAVMEVVWLSELNQQYKGLAKKDLFFETVAHKNTTVDEVWLFVMNIDHYPPAANHFWLFGPFIFLCGLAWQKNDFPFSIISWIFRGFLFFLDCLLPFFNFRGIVPRRQQRPDDPNVPFLAIYFRQTGLYGYYHFKRNEIFVPPKNSFFAGASHINVNRILKLMEGY
jgi:hypothetical protein